MARNLIILDLQGTLVQSMRPPVLNGSLSTLQKLASTNILAIFTGAPKTETLNILKKLKIYSLFNPQNIITKSQFPAKPSPTTIFRLIANNKPNITYYVGDARKDYQTAQNAKIPFIYVGKRQLGVVQINSLDQLLNVTIKL